ncbi:16S rRNA (guanine(966)-N(2))-methyltransferase RsmD [Paludibacterium yongneupense]|uniref:16S rRNA (guanine(966)-N(2))-methyltransferase RsmD n=1 Tax=Paludibacterium yongneupense TaxID=400061 RepID=UPI000403B659|nr:16S rRNA (guanine(966)-N(2))-methyltransferase RsmD [Paludibacterium yongneupense]
MNQQKVRIIGGDYRRRLLPFPAVDGLRPTPDRVRETVFNWLGQRLDGLSCLDLFAGSGALGFEAASRGAARVVMVEKSRQVAASLEGNRTALGAAAVSIAVQDAMLYLRSAHERFDVVFLDPPYALDLLPQALSRVEAVLAEDGVVYFEARAWPGLEGWEVERKDRAGQVHYGLLRRSAVA